MLAWLSCKIDSISLIILSFVNIMYILFNITPYLLILIVKTTTYPKYDLQLTLRLLGYKLLYHTYIPVISIK